VAKETTGTNKKPKIALYSSPMCCVKAQLLLYKGYFNVAWFARAYKDLLNQYEVLTTHETMAAIIGAQDVADTDSTAAHWKVPNRWPKFSPIGVGFDAQVELAAMVARGEVERLLVFQDPLDVLQHLPEMYALIRNCSISNVGLHINAGATFWAESQIRAESQIQASKPAKGFGDWLVKGHNGLLCPKDQEIAFIAHDDHKQAMSNLIYHYRKVLMNPRFRLTGTYGTCDHAKKHLDAQGRPPWEISKITAAGGAPASGHGPTGGDVVIASRILAEWPGAPEKEKLNEFYASLKKGVVITEPLETLKELTHGRKPAVRVNGLSHVVVFFIDHLHAQPHDVDINVLLRVCLHPNHGVHLILNERTAIEWLEAMRSGFLRDHCAIGGS